MIDVNYQDPRAIYEQLVDKYEMLIATGVLKKDERLPSVRAIASKLSINPNTVQKAFSILEDNGYIYSVKGRGSFVAEPSSLRKDRIKKWQDSLTDLISEAIALGFSREDCIEELKNIYDKEGRNK